MENCKIGNCIVYESALDGVFECGKSLTKKVRKIYTEKCLKINRCTTFYSDYV